MNFGTFLMRHVVFGLIAAAIFWGGVFVVHPDVTLAALILWVLADYLWPLWDESSQTLHDKFARTYVVPVHATPGPPPPTMPPPAGRLHRDDGF